MQHPETTAFLEKNFDESERQYATALCTTGGVIRKEMDFVRVAALLALDRRCDVVMFVESSENTIIAQIMAMLPEQSFTVKANTEEFLAQFKDGTKCSIKIVDAKQPTYRGVSGEVLIFDCEINVEIIEEIMVPAVELENVLVLARDYFTLPGENSDS